MSKIKAKCIVPVDLAKHTWPDSFDVLPRVGEQIRPLGTREVQVVVRSIVHSNRHSPSAPGGKETQVELVCDQVKELLVE